jgi:hypothetical protein
MRTKKSFSNFPGINKIYKSVNTTIKGYVSPEKTKPSRRPMIKSIIKKRKNDRTKGKQLSQLKSKANQTRKSVGHNSVIKMFNKYNKNN